MHSYRLGDAGPAVREISRRLHTLGLVQAPSRSYDEHVERAVRTFQQEHGLTVDGVVGASTYRRLDEARWSLGDRILGHLPGDLQAGDDVFALQQRLLGLGFAVGRVDGYFGTHTETGLRDFQHNVGVPADGTCGPATLKALTQLSPIVSGGAPNALRAEERIRDAGPQLRGKVVVIDAWRADNLTPALASQAEEIVVDLARRVQGRLVASGVQALLTAPGAPRADDGPGEETERAGMANRAGAHLSLSLSVDASANEGACGVATYFFGSERHATWSSTGERFAGLVQREIVARTDFVDLRCHAKTWDFLRRTRMPAIRVEAGYLTNTADADRLGRPDFRDTLAEAVVVAVQRFYLSPDVDSATGFLRLSDLQAAVEAESPPSERSTG